MSQGVAQNVPSLGQKGMTCRTTPFLLSIFLLSINMRNESLELDLGIDFAVRRLAPVVWGVEQPRSSARVDRSPTRRLRELSDG
jgi:hypothetical protein